MKTAAIADLKASLSKYISRVKEGEEVLVTERGIPVARLMPVVGARAKAPPRLLELERAGLARIGSGRLPSGFWRWTRPKDIAGLALRALLEDREKGR
jgi:prevent-host-death family protein